MFGQSVKRCLAPSYFIFLIAYLSYFKYKVILNDLFSFNITLTYYSNNIMHTNLVLCEKNNRHGFHRELWSFLWKNRSCGESWHSSYFRYKGHHFYHIISSFGQINNKVIILIWYQERELQSHTPLWSLPLYFIPTETVSAPRSSSNKPKMSILKNNNITP